MSAAQLAPLSNWQLALSVLVPVLVAILAAWLTALLAFRRFRREKVLERKMAAYTTLFKNIYEMQRWCDLWLHYRRTSQPFSNEKQQEIHRNFSDARDDLATGLHAELWLISDRCIHRVERLNEEIGEGHNTEARIKIGAAASSSAIKDLRIFVRAELGLDNSLWPHLTSRAESGR